MIECKYPEFFSGCSRGSKIQGRKHCLQLLIGCPGEVAPRPGRVADKYDNLPECLSDKWSGCTYGYVVRVCTRPANDVCIKSRSEKDILDNIIRELGELQHLRRAGERK